jgi:hypothetical protein
LGEAWVQSVEPTGRKRMQEITLRRTGAGAGGPPIVVIRPRRTAFFFQTRLESKQPVFVLFDPRKPSRAIFPETLI